jgi:hypothetical protein
LSHYVSAHGDWLDPNLPEAYAALAYNIIRRISTQLQTPISPITGTASERGVG